MKPLRSNFPELTSEKNVNKKLQAIRRAIFKQKSRRPKADYDEDTFNELATTTQGNWE